jgi:hypothetical protein
MQQKTKIWYKALYMYMHCEFVRQFNGYTQRSKTDTDKLYTYLDLSSSTETVIMI